MALTDIEKSTLINAVLGINVQMSQILDKLTLINDHLTRLRLLKQKGGNE